MKLYKQLLESGAVSVKQSTKKAQAPAQKAPPKKKNPVRKVKYENGKMVHYMEYE